MGGELVRGGEELCRGGGRELVRGGLGGAVVPHSLMYYTDTYFNCTN